MSTDNLSIFRKIWDILTREERKKGGVMFCLLVVGMLLEALGIGLVVPAVLLITQEDLGAKFPVLQPYLDAVGNPSQGTLIIAGMLTLIGVYLIKVLYLAYLSWVQTRYITSIRVRLSQHLFATYLRQPYVFHLQRNSAMLIRNIIAEVRQTQGGISSSLHLFSEGILLFGVGLMLFIVEPLGALIAGTVLGSAAWIFHRVTRTYITSWGKARKFHDGKAFQHLQQGLGGAKDVKLLGREGDFIMLFKQHNEGSANADKNQSVLRSLPRLWLELLAVSGLAILVLTMLAQGRDLATILPTLGLFAVATFRLMPSVNKILGAIQQLRYNAPAINSLHKEMQLASPDPAADQANTAGPVFDREISTHNLVYRYPGGSSPALDGITLMIRNGESVGFIGPSGSGKSTLIDVILGLLTPTSGQVLVDGQDIQQMLRAWQNQIGYVPQTIYLTDDTLRRNIAFGVPGEQIDDVAVQRAVHAAQLEEFVAELPAGLESVVGERGVRLSGGQRQRIGIARALYHDPAVLVLDEATSALDTATEQHVMKAVTALRGKKTVLIVAHRLSTVEHCDRLYRLDKGRIAAEGAPDKILYSTPDEEDAPADAQAKKIFHN